MSFPTLSAFLKDHYLLEKPLQSSSQQQVEISIRSFESWYGRPIPLSDLTDSLANRWIVCQLAGLSPATVKRQRGDLLAVWRYAANEHRLCRPPDRIRSVKIPRRHPDAWPVSDLAKMIASARKVRGVYPSGIKRSDWWELFISADYDTGLRLSDLLSLPVEVARMESFTVLQNKSQAEMIRRLSPATREIAARTLNVRRELLLPWNYRRETLWAHWRRYILRPSGLPTGRRQGPQKLRRTSASHLERVSPGSAQSHLGHSTPGLADRHYVDRRIAGSEPPLPPSWESGDSA